MPRSFGESPRQSATDAAAALMGVDEAPETAAPESAIAEPQVQAAETQPERGRARQSNGRFAPSAPETPQAAAPQEQPQGEEPPDTTDYKAIAQAREQELIRLRNTYHKNTEDQRAALEAARREAEEARQEKARERERLLAEARAEVDALPLNDPRKLQAERDLAAYELAEERRVRQELEAERTATAERERTQAAVQADQTIRRAAWDSLEQWTIRKGQELGLTATEAEQALNTLKTDDVARLFRELPPRSLIEHTREVLGTRLDAELVRVAESRAERNRQDAIASGAHSHPRTPGQAPPEPDYYQYTRNAKTPVRLGRRAAANAIMHGLLTDQ